MKHIVKNDEPQELLAWKATDKMYMRGKPNYKRIKGPLKIVLSSSLRLEQGNICCYCERPISESDSHIEHIQPQDSHIHLSCEYSNMLCSCQNEVKGDPRHCGASKGSWYKEDLFVSPLDPNCETKFKYTLDGQIQPANSADQAAKKTIEKCQLAIPKLKALRQSVIDTFTDGTILEEDLPIYVRGYLIEKEVNNNSYNAFYTTIKSLFGHLLPTI